MIYIAHPMLSSNYATLSITLIMRSLSLILLRYYRYLAHLSVVGWTIIFI